MKTRSKWLRWTALVGLGVIVGGYAAYRIWRWASVPKDAPVIGVSLDTAWHAQVGITTKWYEIGLTRAGGKILELRPGSSEPEEILDRIDGLLLAGGGDVDPALYGGTPDDAQLVDRPRDDFDLALIRGALKRNMPILGICRGIQILNVSQGGTVRNLRDEPRLGEVHGISVNSFDAHPVDIAAGSILGLLLGAGHQQANSFHGQAVGKLGRGVRATAAAPDGVVEGIELPDRRFVIGMQWHPEIPPQKMAVFNAFLQEAQAYRRRRPRLDSPAGAILLPVPALTNPFEHGSIMPWERPPREGRVRPSTSLPGTRYPN